MTGGTRRSAFSLGRLCALILALSLLSAFPAGAAQAAGASGAVVRVALDEVGYTEGPKEQSKYGSWYGLPGNYWCDMFVSWCAAKANVPRAVFPRAASCSAHIQAFTKLGGWQLSAAQGGAYVPRQGDLVFFRKPGARNASHVGLVLYVEDGTLFSIEGNTLAVRKDYPFETLYSVWETDQGDPYDYVTVNDLPLDSSKIFGYAVPNYSDRTPLELEGIVDLGRYAERRTQFEYLAGQGIMPGTSSHTYSPAAGMSRGAFLTLLMSALNISGWDEETKPFSDVPEDSPYYAAVMSARCAGITKGSGGGRFDPDTYITGTAAQTMLSRALAYLEEEDQAFSFGPGDLSHILTPYTTRADIASALYALAERGLIPSAQEEEAGEADEAEAPGKADNAAS